MNKVGKTRTGKHINIYLSDGDIRDSISIANFSMDDHFDAFAVYEYLALRSKRRNGEDCHWLKRFSNLAIYHERILLNNKEMEYAAERAAVHGALDLREHGKHLSSKEFQDL